ncbi:MAG: RluA family pseudouridine synthase [Rhodoluna sp.]|nr:RluA family pseudouridine synthase [Rhodoluna sp.]
MSEPRLLPVPESLEGERVDAALAKMLGLSRSAAADLISAGSVTLDNQTVLKSHRVSTDQMLEVTLAEKRDALEVVAVDVDDLRIVYEDTDLVVIDKPAGVAAHPSVGWTGPTVVGALLAKGVRISTSGAAERQGIVQRLDVGTSGLMMVAKTEVAYSRLKQAFRDRAVHKVYHAVIQGHPDPFEGTIDAPIGRHPKAEFKFAVMNEGKPSVTHYKLLEAFASASLIEVILETGRTHQIRVHFSAFKHPLLGDTMYGADPTLASRMNLERQWLHAVRLSFMHPTSGEQVSFESPHSEELQQALELLKSN